MDYKALKCPVCGDRLCRSEEGNSLLCQNRHSFDIARQGYINLTNGKAAPDSGDPKEMVAARKVFLDSGAYLPFASSVADIIKDELGSLSFLTVADAGCGEGYYTVHIAKEGATVYGFDLSKSAVRSASVRASAEKVSESSLFSVASVYSLPLLDGSCDALISLFAPAVHEEYMRVLRDGGIYIVGAAGERHLYELKEELYDKVRLNSERKDLPEGISCKEKHIEYKMHLKKQEIEALYLMTPYSRRTSKEAADRLLKRESLDITAAFDLFIFKKEKPL